MTENLYDNPDAPEETADAAQAPVAAADASAQPIVTSNGTVIPARSSRSSPIASLIGKKDFGIEPLSPKDYYPTIGEPVQIGQFNGKYIGSMAQYSGAGALYPYAIVDARRRALEQAAMLSKLQEEQAKNVKHEALPQRAWTKPAFQNHLNNQFQDAFQKVKSKYASEADFWKDYDAKGQAYIDVDTAAKNTHSFAQGVDVLFKLGDEMKTAEKEGKFVPKDYREELNKILREGEDVSDPDMQKRHTALFNTRLTENLDAPLKEASESLSKRVKEQYVDLETLAKRKGFSTQDMQGERLKIEQTVYSPENIDAEADKILANHKAGAINEYTTKVEREKYKDDEDKLTAIAKENLVDTITRTTPKKYKEQIEGSVDKSKTSYGSGSAQNAYARMQIADAKADILPGQVSTREAMGLDKVTKGKQDFVVDITYLNPKGVSPEIELPAGEIYSVKDNELGNTVIDKLEPLQGVQYFKPNRFRNIDGKLFLEVTKKTVETEFDPLTGQVKTPVESSYMIPATEAVKNKMDTEYGINVDKVIDSYKKSGDKKAESSTGSSSHSSSSSTNKEAKKIPVPKGQSATITQGGHTYTWNENTGKYE